MLRDFQILSDLADYHMVNTMIYIYLEMQDTLTRGSSRPRDPIPFWPSSFISAFFEIRSVYMVYITSIFAPEAKHVFDISPKMRLKYSSKRQRNFSRTKVPNSAICVM